VCLFVMIANKEEILTENEVGSNAYSREPHYYVQSYYYTGKRLCKGRFSFVTSFGL
jgi:hypothetical protein